MLVARIENRVGREKRLGKHQPAIGAVVEGPLQPLGRGGMRGVPLQRNQETGQAR